MFLNKELHLQNLIYISILMLTNIGLRSADASGLSLTSKEIFHIGDQSLKSVSYLFEGTLSATQRILVLYAATVHAENIISLLQKQISTKFIPIQYVNVNTVHDDIVEIACLEEEDIVVSLTHNWQFLSRFIRGNQPIGCNKSLRWLLIYMAYSSPVSKQNIFNDLSRTFRKRIMQIVVIYVSEMIENSPGSHTYKSNVSLILYHSYSQLDDVQDVALDTLVYPEKIFEDVYSSLKLLNFHGRPLRITTHVATTHPFFRFQIINGKHIRDGILPNALDALSKYMNYTPEYVIVHKKTSYGQELPNGSWTGLVGDLQTKDVDIEYSGLLASYGRTKVLDFSEFFALTPTSILVPKGRSIPAWESLLNILHYYVILSIFGSYILMVVARHILQLRKKEENKLHRLILEMLGVLVAISVKQPKQNASRILYFTWAYFNMITSAIYAGCIVSVLTIPRHYPDINTFETLAKSNIVLRGFPYMSTFFTDSSNPVFSLLHDRYQPDTSYQEILQNIREGQQVAAVGAPQILGYYSQIERPCPMCSEPFHVMDVNVQTVRHSIGMKKCSQFVHRINEIIRRIREAGLFDKWYSDVLWKLELTHPCFKHCAPNKVLTLEDVQASFYVLTLGIIIAVNVFLTELMYHKKKICKVSV